MARKRTWIALLIALAWLVLLVWWLWLREQPPIVYLPATVAAQVTATATATAVASLTKIPMTTPTPSRQPTATPTVAVVATETFTAVPTDTPTSLPATVTAVPSPTWPAPYVVQPGDHLWGIGSQFYANGRCWAWIYNQNRDVVEDPNLVYSGEQLWFEAGGCQ